MNHRFMSEYGMVSRRCVAVVGMGSGVLLGVIVAAVVCAQARAGDWIELGPAPIVGSSYTGRVSAVVTSGVNPNKYYVAGADGGVWRTLDGGVTWEPLADELSICAVGALALDPNDDNIVYAGSGEANYANHSLYGLGLYKTTDGGATWQVFGADTFSGRTFSRLMVSPTDSNVLYAAIGHAGGFPARVAGKGHPGVDGDVGIFRSRDAGQTWTQLTNGLPNVAGTDVVVDPTDGNRVFAAIGDIFGHTDNGIYVSTDGGDSWTKLTGGLPTSGFGRVSLAIAPTNPNRLYTIITRSSSATGGGASTLGVYRTDDGGGTWVNTNSGNFQASYGWYLSTAVVDPNNPDTFFVGGLNLLRGVAGGGSYANRTPPHVDMHGLAFDAAGRLLAADDGGLHRSPDLGNSWASLNVGLGLIQFYAGFQDNGSNIRTGGLEWRSVVGGDGGYTSLSPDNPDIMLAEYQGTGNLFRSTDGGGSFRGSAGGITRSDRNCFLPPHVFDPQTPMRMLYGTHRVYESINNGGNWRAISGDLTGGGTAAIRGLAIAPSNSQTVYAATNDGRVLVSTDGGSNWDLRISGNPGWPRVTRELAVDPLDDATAYVAVAWFGVDQVLETTDRGATWHAIDGDLPDVPANTVAVYNDGNDRFVFLGTDAGVFLTDDGGAHWELFGPELPNSPVVDLVVDPVQGRLLAATQGRGVWHAALPVVTCDPLRKFKVKCKSSGKLVAQIKSDWVEGTRLRLTNNGTDQKRMTIKASGKGKTKWKNQSSGPHEVCLVECSQCKTVDCP